MIATKQMPPPGTDDVPARRSGLQSFLVIWLGQVVSLLGSRLTSFAVGVWIYQTTGSATSFSLMTLANVLPGILMSPIAGALVDRWDRRRTLLLSDAASGICSVLLMSLVWTGRLEVWHIYLLVAAHAVFDAVQTPAFSASVPLLVPKRHLGRASGINQVGNATARIVSPLLAGMLIGSIGLHGIILTDLVTFGVAMATLLVARLPQPPRSAEGEAGRGNLLREATAGWHYLRARPGLMSLLIMFAGVNFAMGTLQVLITPMVLSFASPKVLGTVLSVAAGGVLIGGLLMSVWGGPSRRILGVFIPIVVQALILFLSGLRPSATLIAAAAFIFLFCFPIIAGSATAIWQSKIPADLQGRVFAVQRLVAWSTLPLAYLVAGPLADHVFEPLLAPGGRLAGSVGQVIGVGPGRGIALIFMVLGILILGVLAIGYRNPRLRNLEEEIPDAIPGEPLLAKP
ncbi:MAG TPA: MFS transporter [Thermoanaerobaculia bacterium]|nr:MFS transporter [Thermoanaerobaculia bacterium]